MGRQDRKTRRLVRAVANELKGIIVTQQEDLDAAVAQLSDVAGRLDDTSTRISSGVDELDAEITRLDNLNTVGSPLDLSGLKAVQARLASASDALSAVGDALANDNIPAAPPAPTPIPDAPVDTTPPADTTPVTDPTEPAPVEPVPADVPAGDVPTSIPTADAPVADPTV